MDKLIFKSEISRTPIEVFLTDIGYPCLKIRVSETLVLGRIGQCIEAILSPDESKQLIKQLTAINFNNQQL